MQTIADFLNILPQSKLSNSVSFVYFSPCYHYCQATEEQIKLLGYQRRLEEQYQQHYSDLSLHDTIKRLVGKNLGKLAEQLKKEFKVPDKG